MPTCAAVHRYSPSPLSALLARSDVQAVQPVPPFHALDEWGTEEDPPIFSFQK
jgi:hypothetical protein